jgi:acyl transferase domain-containing protein
MLAVGLGAQEVKAYLEGQEGLLVLACHNSPNSVTVSGDAEAVHELQSTLTTKGIFARMLKTGGQAYHSHHMAEVSSRYRKLLDLESRSLGSPSKDGQRLPMFSTVTGTLVDRPSMSAMYWCENLTSPVLFNQATHAMLKSDLEIKIIVEIGPHSTLSGPIRQICAAANLSSIHYMPSLKRGENDHAAILKLVGQLWAYHLPIDTEAVTSREYMEQDGSVVRENGKLLVDLPPYEWTYAKRHWAESRQSKEHRQSPYPRHDLLGRKVLGTSDIEPVWRNILRHKDLPWLKHHSVCISNFLNPCTLRLT